MGEGGGPLPGNGLLARPGCRRCQITPITAAVVQKNLTSPMWPCGRA